MVTFFMASQISHIYYAQQFLKKYPQNKDFDEKAFILGNVFPDIRYLANLDRDITHGIDPEIEQVLAESNSFQKGRLLHCHVDYKRDQIYEKSDLYSQVPKTKYVAAIFKYFEDELLYPEVDNWGKYVAILNSPAIPEETQYTPKENIERWRGLIGKYFADTPTPEGALSLLVKVRFTPKEVIQIIDLLHQMRANQTLVDQVHSIAHSIIQ